MHEHSPVIRLHPSDTVAVALQAIASGQTLHLHGRSVVAAQAIPQGHKIALAEHATGGCVVKYGHTIGLATRQIAPGEHVHSHNLATALAGELAYHAQKPPERMTGAINPSTWPGTWQGYLRADGRAATRNEIWILPTVGCVGALAEHIARESHARHAGRVDGIYAFAHPHGCSQLGDDLASTRAILAGLATNPNAGAVLILGLGCESNQLEPLLGEVPAHLRAKIHTLSSQSAADEEAEAHAMLDAMVEAIAHDQRQTLPLSKLCIGLKCGGSDGLSGLTANPLLGRLTDTITAAGGAAILTEIPEIFGAEQALLNRAIGPDVFARAAGLINRFKRYYLDQGLPVSENPSPGNLAGGITTLEEKSLGAVQKAGRAPLCDVIAYGQLRTAGGVTLLEAPGNDAISSTALAAAGANVIVVTTGRGTPLGFPVPTIKVASNPALAAAKPHWIDFDAARVLDEGQEVVDEAFLRLIIDVASGKPVAAEPRGQRSIAIWKRGVTL